MSDNKRKADTDDSRRKKKKYRSDGTPIWSKRHIDGPGVWVSCVKGKEKQTVGEVYDLFESIASDIWPQPDAGAESAEEDDNDSAKPSSQELSLEEQIAREVSDIKKPRSAKPDQRFSNCQTNTPCVVFISCKPPVDPVELVVHYVRTVQETGITRTRYTHRFVPVADSCVANLPEIEALCRKVFGSFFASERHQDQTFTYKIELRIRNHTTIPRQLLIKSVASCVPDGHTVDLQNPQLFILVEVFKSVCGVSIVRDYYQLAKFNVMEIANKKKSADADDPASESRVKVTKGVPNVLSPSARIEEREGEEGATIGDKEAGASDSLLQVTSV